ncbi:MAG TPA: hypothetical protein VEK57_19270 [Thermoanaerobaculia bacterium]|nr:hypothetical protein [Thermoanaerobaculia bacterium]
MTKHHCCPILLLLIVTLSGEAAVYPTAGPRSTDNDDSCDIALLPAATLLLPYYEVEFGAGGKTTLFTVMNVSHTERIAHVTLWTDHRFPLLTFDLRLAPYDARSINLYDVIAGGRIESCDGTQTLSAEVLARLRKAITKGIIYVGSESCDQISGAGPNAIGFATIDLVASCTTLTPEDPAYYTEAIRFDNVLAGDYQHVDPRQGTAEGSSLVHIRAIPEGSDAATRSLDPRFQTNFPNTFYGRYQDPARLKLDGRQPLPTAFAVPWEADTHRGIATSYTIWHEAESVTSRRCEGRWVNDYARLFLTEMVHFDAEENPQRETVSSGVYYPYGTETKAAGRYANDLLPTSFDPRYEHSGWVYFNFREIHSSGRKAQAWVIATRSEGRTASARDTAALGNGCSPSPTPSETPYGGGALGPAPNVNP